MDKIIMAYVGLSAVTSEFTIYTPDSLLSYSIPYQLSTIGSPGLYPLLGTLLEISPTGCSFDSYTLNNFIPLLKKPENCSYSQLSISAQQQEAPYIIFLTDDEENIQEAYDSTLVGIPVLSIQESIYTQNLSKDSSILLSYQYRVEYVDSPSIEVRLVGGFASRLMFIESLLDLDSSLAYDFTNFSASFSYGLFDKAVHEAKQDCIAYKDLLYCDKGEVPGAELLSTSIISLNIYKDIPKTPKSMRKYLAYLQSLYSNCTLSPIDPCHTKLLKQFQYTHNESYETLQSFSFSNLGFSDFLVNTHLFLWPSHLTQAFCLSSKSSSPNCPLCSSRCKVSSYFTESCLDNCNSSACGYSNMLCLSYNGDPLCLNQMIDDGMCSVHCIFEEECKESKGKLPKDTRFEVFLIVLCIIIPLFCLLGM